MQPKSYKLIGWHSSGIVATETTNAYWHALKIAATWRDAGLTVEIVEVKP